MNACLPGRWKWSKGIQEKDTGAHFLKIPSPKILYRE